MKIDYEFTSNNGSHFSTFISNIKFLIYIPAYNCEKTIVDVINTIPEIEQAAILVFDNSSSDCTVDKVRNCIENNSTIKTPLSLMQSKINLGYAGSQKKIYETFRDIPHLEWIIMLHGDSQYDPLLINKLLPHFESDNDLVYGFRSKFEKGEETPLFTYIVIKLLSLLESVVCGHYQKEWHSGFVMYRCRFLRSINLDKVTDTRHIDGQMLLIASKLGAKIKSIPIYKKYKNLIAFSGSERREYVIDVFKFMFNFRNVTSAELLRKL